MLRKLVLCVSLVSMTGPAAAIPTVTKEQLAEQQMLETAMAAAMEELLATGPVSHDWSKGGIDIIQMIAATPGGAAGNVLLSTDKDGDTDVTFVGAKDAKAMVPTDWEVVSSEGDINSLPNANLLVGHLDGRYYVVGRDNERRVEDGYCSSGEMVGSLYKAPRSVKPGEMPEHLVPVIFSMVLRRLKDQTICYRYDRDGNGYRMSYFLEDGTTLPAMNATEERVTIVPTGSVEALLHKPQ